MNIRAQAAHALVPLLQHKMSLNKILATNSEHLPAHHRAFFRELCFGVARHYFSLDALTKRLLDKAMKPKDTDVQALILIGLYQLLYMRVPNHAAINETVNAAKILKKAWAAGMINAVLRRFLREQKSLLTDVNNIEAIRYDHPPWLVKKIKSAWPKMWKQILENNNLRAPFTLRVNHQQTSRDDFSNILEQHKIPHQRCAFTVDGLTLDTAIDVEQVPGFVTGACSVQDEAAQLAAPLLKLHTGQRVLDACCAPGGKTCHIAEQEPNLGKLIAIDLDASRLQRVQENLKRLKLRATLVTAAVEDLDQWWDGNPFDRILLDAPCSATGVIRRHPDIKLLRRVNDIDHLTALQTTLLDNLWTTLKPHGLLLYATCSVLPQENEKLVEAFVAKRADAIHLPIAAGWGEQRPFGRQLFPQQYGHDGFFYALLRKAPGS